MRGGRVLKGTAGYRFQLRRDPSFPLALCANGEHDPDMWHHEEPAARQVCFKCPEVVPCADWGTTKGAPPYGVLGGFTAEDRAKLRRARELKEWQ